MAEATEVQEPPALLALRERWGGAVREVVRNREQFHVVVDRDAVVDMLKFLRDDPAHEFTFLADLSAVDDFGDEPRFRVFYVLRSLRDRREIVLMCRIAEDDCRMPSITRLFATANWLERECFDMYGVHFDGHPDLRRILMPEVFTDFPMRKDFPMTGKMSDQEWAAWVIARAQRPEGSPDA